MIKISILGAGPAGCSVAYALKKVGINPQDIAILEKEDYVGGCPRTNFIENNV